MPITTRYVCDHCGRSQDTPHQMWEVAATYRPIEMRNSTAAAITKAVLWCRPCCEEAGILGRHAAQPGEAKPTPSPPPTIESLVRALVEDVVKNALEEGRDGSTNG